MRGARVGFVFQDPMTSLNPVFTVGMQIMEPLRTHKGMSKPEAEARAVELWSWWGYRMRGSGWGSIRTSSRAGCASG